MCQHLNKLKFLTKISGPVLKVLHLNFVIIWKGKKRKKAFGGENYEIVWFTKILFYCKDGKECVYLIERFCHIFVATATQNEKVRKMTSDEQTTI